MRTKLVHIGDELGVVIDSELLEQLGIDGHSELEVTTDGVRLFVEPVSDRRRRVLAAAEKVAVQHDRTLRKLSK